MSQLVWLRNDLRLTDNPALYHAWQIGCQRKQPVRVIYCATPNQWQKHNLSQAQLGLCQDLLRALQSELSALNIALDIIEAPDYLNLPEKILSYCLTHKVQALWLNKEVPFNKQQRDSEVINTLLSNDIVSHCFDNDLLVNSPITTQSEASYRVFTPWYRRWLATLLATDVKLLAAPNKALDHPQSPSCSHTSDQQKTIAIGITGNYRSDLWPASETFARERLTDFIENQQPNNTFNYHQRRDYPAINGTSLLSAYIAVGAISIRQCYLAIYRACSEQQQSIEENQWLKELGWREFYRYLMLNNQGLSKGFAFNPHKEPKWLNNPQLLSAWQQGRTGFPIIDAAMLQLNRTSWMHNRLRMLTASFLCKLLLIDWREGETYFMAHLIDADFPSNNGGWQWSSATGCDASPWFRIFNPTSQSKKFDSQGHFIRKMLPELSTLNDKDIHWPSDQQRTALNYCSPIIDYATCRERALKWHKR